MSALYRRLGFLGSSQETADLSLGKQTLLTMLRGQGHVESFTLAHPSPLNDHTGVTLYLVRTGYSKKKKTKQHIFNDTSN